jgi:predicted glycosyltransferase
LKHRKKISPVMIFQSVHCSTADIRANSVDRYTINRDTIIGQNRDNPRYDIMSAVIVNVGNKHDAKDTDSRMLKMLNEEIKEVEESMCVNA